MTLFHFEYVGETGWEAVGAGLGEGKDPARAAFREVRELSGGSLPAGTYRFIVGGSGDGGWQTFRVDSLGRMTVDRHRERR